jgi:hypothetical protein
MMNKLSQIISAISCFCFGVSFEDLVQREDLKPRLIAVVTIAAFSRTLESALNNSFFSSMFSYTFPSI